MTTAAAQRVLDVTLELFSEHGFEGTSLQQVADRLGVTKAAVYYHFPSKDEMLAAIVDPAFAELHAILDEAEAAPTPRARQRLALEGYADYLLRHRVTTAWMSRDAAALTRPTVLERSRTVEARLQALLGAGHDDDLARLWTGVLGHAVLGAVTARPAPDEQWLREELGHLVTALLNGARAARRRHED